MIRFRNPTSNVNQLCEIFKQLFYSLKDAVYFTNDDIKRIATDLKLMSSSGFTGSQAAVKGYNSNKNLDKPFNNAKMLAEVYRHLGLISVIDNSKSHYRFTFLGEHMLISGVNLKKFIEQCYLGMVCPNKIIDVLYKDEMRFCLFTLNVMNELPDNCICSKELVIGPMNGIDTDIDTVANTVTKIENVRKQGNINDVAADFAKSCTEYKKDGMKLTSATNQTRLLDSMLVFTGLAKNDSSPKYYREKGNSVQEYMHLTSYGKSILALCNNMKDIRLSEYNLYSECEKEALIRIGFYQMLSRIGFDISPMTEQLNNDLNICADILQGKELLFSPYQMLEYHVVNKALGITELHSSDDTPSISDNDSRSFSQSLGNKVNRLELKCSVASEINTDANDTMSEYIHHVNELSKSQKNSKAVVNMIVKEHKNDNMDEYYGFVVMLFRFLGLDCRLGRHGDNSSRMDAIIVDSVRSIPIEIKSPGETEYVNVKAIRQALENKIILLSRQEYKTDISTPSFAVGYKIPNERSEVSELIKAFKETYGITIVAFGIETLVNNSINIILEHKGINPDDLFKLEEGLIK